jgi:subtilisin family serine protease
MDPALAELIEAGDDDDHVRVLARFMADSTGPEELEVVSRFGDVVTCDTRRGALTEMWADPRVVSLKAPRPLEHNPTTGQLDDARARYEDERRPEPLREHGQGIVIACCDWGIDFAHPDFRRDDGTTRFMAIWDQRGERGPHSPRQGYGIAHSREAIDRALRASDPYAALGYHPADTDLGHGCHGTHCLSIAAGTGTEETPSGLAPVADLVFVHLDSPRAQSECPLGDSVTLLDALDFCRATAAGAPLVISLSLGSHGGPHDGSSLVERAIDNLITERPGLAVCQSTGNYFERRTHTSGRLRPGEVDRIGWITERAEANPHALEVWYAGTDRIVATLTAPEGGVSVSVAPGQSRQITVAGTRAGSIYNRLNEPNNGQNHINAFIYPAVAGGRWELSLCAEDVADGRYHCWIEREAGCPACQSHLDDPEIVKQTTTGSVCNGLRAITVGAYDAHSADRPLAPFSSSGPTRDGRTKPDILAPGVSVLAARSTPRGDAPASRATRMSGTSMAAPFVAGTVALMLEAAGGTLSIAEIRRALSETAQPAGLTGESALRAGDGYIDVERAITSVRAANSESEERELADPRAWEGGLSFEAFEAMQELEAAGVEQQVEASGVW